MKKICEINGKRYMSPSSAADLWGMTYQAVSRACFEGRVVGADRNGSDKWIIPIDAEKPLDNDIIRQILVVILVYKNKGLTMSTKLSVEEINMLKYCMNIGVLCPVEDVSKANIKDLILSDKGMRMATEGNKKSLNWVSSIANLIQVGASIITLLDHFKLMVK